MRHLKLKTVGSGCDSVGRAVASDSRGPRFESSHCLIGHITFMSGCITFKSGRITFMSGCITFKSGRITFMSVCITYMPGHITCITCTSS